MADTTPSQGPLRLAEALERMRPEFCGNQATLLEAAALIREQHAALAAPQPNAAADGWISVLNRLPEPDEPVLVHNGRWTGVGAWVSGDYIEPLERWQDEHREFIEMCGPSVTHWQPTTKGPKCVGQ